MATVLELESVYCDTEERGVGGVERAGSNHTQEEEMEVAVLIQELCSIKEERADLRYITRNNNKNIYLSFRAIHTALHC
jgi:hypothetical protein